jgi:hypothetical protein
MSYAHRIEGERQIALADFDSGADAGLQRKEAKQQTARLIA